MRYSRVFIDAIGYELAPVVVSTTELEDRLAPLYERLRLAPEATMVGTWTKDLQDDLRKLVEKTPRHVISAAVIDQANQLLGLLQRVRYVR
jgi:hypothetical protein